MSDNSKVLWSEGMFLKPQHFQQQERYLETLIWDQPTSLRPNNFGLYKLKIDQKLLLLGEFSILCCQGVLPDGTVFDVPSEASPPRPLKIPPGLSNTLVYLALPLKRSGIADTAVKETTKGVYRYRTEIHDVESSNNEMTDVSEMQVKTLSFQLLLETEDLSGYLCLPIAKIKESREGNNITLDEEFLPPSLTIEAHPKFTMIFDEIIALLRNRGEALAKQITDPGYGGTAEIADFMLLQLINRNEMLLEYFLKRKGLHPEKFFIQLLQLLGELLVFTHKERRPTQFYSYQHDSLQESFDPVVLELRRSLGVIFAQSAISLELKEQTQGILVSVIPEKELLKTADFVLAVHANVSAETIHQTFSNQIKIASPEKIQELINRLLPGVDIKGLPAAPRQIPFNSGFTYFVLNRDHDLWKDIEESGSIAFHISGEFPGLELEFWAIRRRK